MDRRETASRVTAALSALGWEARTEYLAGGLWGTVVLTDDDETNVLVALDADDDGGPFFVGPDCQSHPGYGIDTLEVPQYAPEASIDPLVSRLTPAIYAVAKSGPHSCEDCADRYAEGWVCGTCGNVFPSRADGAVETDGEHTSFRCLSCVREG